VAVVAEEDVASFTATDALWHARTHTHSPNQTT
jgi:hypothetical protein